MLRPLSISFAIALLIVTGIFAFHLRAIRQPIASRAHSASLPQDIYIWQRAWTPSVRQAVSDEHQQFHRFVVLAAQITIGSKPPKQSQIQPDYVALAQSVREIGLAIRIGPIPSSQGGVFDPQSPQTKFIATAALASLTAPRHAGLSVAEIQIDFDCAESKLPGYLNWVKAVRAAVAPTRVVITALPSWLKQPAFAELARQAGSFVLQVHSLHKPENPHSPMTLCDANEARAAVVEASRIGVPFRVALPTYSYLAAFMPDGKFLGLSAEGPEPSWPAGTILRHMRSDAPSIAGLVRDWTDEPPPGMTGILWYRLPISDDSMNWRPLTLHAVMAGRAPRGNIRADATRRSAGLFDISLYNAGDDDAPITGQIELAWSAANLILAEALENFDRLDSPSNTVIFRATGESPGRWIAPGERVQIGWIRLSADTEVRTHVSPTTTASTQPQRP